MVKHPIRELVREVFIGSNLDDNTVKAHYLSKVLPLTDKELPFEEFFEGERFSILKNLWTDSFKASNYPSFNRMYDKMSITKHIAVHPRDIGKDKTFYFIGKRYTKVSDVKKIAEHYGWTWETKDPTKAQFIILGDSPSWEEASINAELKLPVVMDDSLRVDLHFLFNPEVVNVNINEEIVATFLNSGNFEHFKLVVSMIQYLKEDVISSENQLRLIRAYITAFKNFNTTFDLKNKEHVWISDTVQRYCHPFHRSLVTNAYLTNRNSSVWYMSTFRGREKRPSTYGGNNKTSLVYRIQRTFEFMHACEGESNVYKSDLVDGNRYSLIPAVKYTRKTDYSKFSYSTLKGNDLYMVSLYLNDFRNTILYVTPHNKEFNIVCTGIAKDIYGSSTDISDPENMFRHVNRDLWEANYESKIKPLFLSMLKSLELNPHYNIVVKDENYIDYALKYDELLLELKIFEDDEQKYEQELKFQKRKDAISQL